MEWPILDWKKLQFAPVISPLETRVGRCCWNMDSRTGQPILIACRAARRMSQYLVPGDQTEEVGHYRA